MESRYKIFNGTLYMLSVQQLIDCAGLFYWNDGCNGGWSDEAMQYAQDAGMVEDSYYPYQA